MFSANVALEEGTTDESSQAHRPTTDDRGITNDELRNTDADQQLKTDNGQRTTRPSFGTTAWASVAIALALMVGIFFVLPVVAANVITWWRITTRLL